MTVVKRYGNYIEEECCTECNWAAKDADTFYFRPTPNVCPECGGKTEFTVGRWVYSEMPVKWYHWLTNYGIPETVYYGFEKGRERDINHKKLVVEPCDCDGDLQIIVKFDDGKIEYERGGCDCPSCTVSDSRQLCPSCYQPCHNREELSEPPNEDSTTIKEFMALSAPMENDDGKWVVCVADDKFLVLSLARELEYGPDLYGADFEFDSEKDAHFAAAFYYNQNLGRSYPYYNRLLELCNEE